MLIVCIYTFKFIHCVGLLVRPFQLEPCVLWLWEVGFSPRQFLSRVSHFSSLSLYLCMSFCVSVCPCLCLHLCFCPSVFVCLSVSVPISLSSLFLCLNLAGVSKVYWAGAYLFTHPFPAHPSYVCRKLTHVASQVPLSYERPWQETGRWEQGISPCSLCFGYCLWQGLNLLLGHPCHDFSFCWQIPAPGVTSPLVTSLDTFLFQFWWWWQVCAGAKPWASHLALVTLLPLLCWIL